MGSRTGIPKLPPILMKFSAFVVLLVVSILIKVDFRNAFVLRKIYSKYYKQKKPVSLKKAVFCTVLANSF